LKRFREIFSKPKIEPTFFLEENFSIRLKKKATSITGNAQNQIWIAVIITF